MKEIINNHYLVQNAIDEVMLIYSDEHITTYTENTMRGEGVLSITINPGNNVTFYTLENEIFGEIACNEDLVFTVQMPAEIIARRVVPNNDFAAFQFDADTPRETDEFIYIYINKQKLKVQKNAVNYSYLPWTEYVNAQIISAKPYNKLHIDENGKDVLLDDDVERVFKITEIRDDIMQLTSTVSGCCGHSGKFIDGQVRWKHENILLVNFTID